MEGTGEHGDDLIFMGEEDKKLPFLKTVFHIRKDLIEKAVESVKASKLQNKCCVVKNALLNCDLNDTDDFKNAPAHRNSKLKLKTFSSALIKNASLKEEMLDDGEIIAGSTSVIPKSKLSFGNNVLNLSCMDQLKSCYICGSSFEIKELESHVQHCLRSKFSKNPDLNESIFCSICKKNLSHLNSQRQTHHINKCMNKVEICKENDKYQELIETAKKAVLNCPMCGKKLKTLPSRLSHLKKCAASNKMSAEQVKNMVKQQEEEHISKLNTGILPEDFLHLSRSSKHLKSKIVNTSTLLFTLSKEKAQDRISQRVDKYVFSKICSSTSSQTPPFKIKPVNNDVIKFADLDDNRLWKLTSLASIEDCHRSQFYVQKLVPPISISCLETGSKLKSISIIPGRRKSVEDQQEEQKCEGTLNSQTLEILTHLAKENEVNEQEEVGISNLQRSHSTNAMIRQSDNSKSSIEDFNNSGFYPSTPPVSKESCPTSLQESFLSLVDNQFFSDVVILTQERKLFAHRVVLHARCSKLLNMVQCHGETNIIDLTSFLEDSVLSVLKFIYADYISLAESNVSDIVKLSVMLGLTKLAATALSYCVTTNMGHTNTEKYICINNNKHEDKTDWLGMDEDDWKDIFHSQRKNLYNKPTTENQDVLNNFKITVTEIGKDASITKGNVSKIESKLNKAQENELSDDCDKISENKTSSDCTSFFQRILKEKNCAHDIGPVVNSILSDADNMDNVSCLNDDKLINSDMSLNLINISSASANKVTNCDKINSSFSNKLGDITCGNKTPEIMVEENNVIKSVENNLSISILSDNMLQHSDDLEIKHRNDITLDNIPKKECFRMLGEDSIKTQNSLNDLLQSSNQQQSTDQNSGNGNSMTSSGNFQTPSLDKNVSLRKRKRKKVSKKDFQNIVSKIISKSVEGHQSLSELLSADDVENIAVKMEQDFLTIYQDADANDSVYFPCILDQVNVDTDDIMITFADIKDPIKKKSKGGRAIKPTMSNGENMKESPVLTSRKLQKGMKSKISSSYVLSNQDKTVINSQDFQLVNKSLFEHLSSNISDTVKMPYQLPVVDTETRPTLKSTSIINMNLTSISKEITQQLTDSNVYKKLCNSYTYQQNSDSDTSWLIDQTISFTPFPQINHETINDQLFPQPVHSSMISLENSKNKCISDDELFSDNDQNSPDPFPLNKEGTDFKSIIDDHWSVSTLPISSSPLDSNKELRNEAASKNTTSEKQAHLISLSPKGKETSLKEKMFNIISDVVISHMIPKNTNRQIFVDKSSSLAYGSNDTKLSHLTTSTIFSVREKKSQISETSIINAKQVQQINNYPIKKRLETTKVAPSVSKTNPIHLAHNQAISMMTSSPIITELSNKNVEYNHVLDESCNNTEDSGTASTAENMNMITIKVQSDSPKIIRSLKPSIYLKNAGIETEKLTTSQSSLIQSNTENSYVTSQHVAYETQEKSKKNGYSINNSFSTPVKNNQHKDNSFNSMDIPNFIPSPPITNGDKSPAKTRRGLAKKNSPLLMSSTILNKTSEIQSESWVSSLSMSNSAHNVLEMNQFNDIQKNRLVAYGSKNDNLELEKSGFSKSNSSIPKSFISDFTTTSDCKFPRSELLSQAIKVKEGNLQEEEPLPSCNDSNNHNAPPQNIKLQSLPLNNIENTERKLTLSNAIDVASPLPLRQRLRLQNVNMNQKVGIASEKDSVMIDMPVSQAKEEKLDSIFEDTIYTSRSEIEVVTSPSKEKKNENFMTELDKINCKTPVNQNIFKQRKKNARKEPSPFTPMPQFDEMTTPDLTKAASKIGVRPVGKKRLRELLKHVYHVMHQYETDSEYDGTPIKHPRSEILSTNINETSQKSNQANVKNKVKQKSSKINLEPKSIISNLHPKKQNVSSSLDNVKHCQQKAHVVKENNVLMLSLDSSYSDCPEESILQSWTEEESPSEPYSQLNSETPVQRLAQFVTDNKDIYHSILLYEPLELDILKKRLSDFGIKISMEKVMDFLDERCITFTMKNLNKGHSRNQRRQRPKKSPKKRAKQ